MTREEIDAVHRYLDPSDGNLVSTVPLGALRRLARIGLRVVDPSPEDLEKATAEIYRSLDVRFSTDSVGRIIVYAAPRSVETVARAALKATPEGAE